MPVNADTLRLHLDYSAWASRRLVDAAAGLTPEQLTRDFNTADRNVLGTLVHVYAADRVWLGRIQGNPPARFIDPDTDMQLPILQNDWPALSERWRQWASALDQNSIETRIPYKDLKGNPYETPLWQIVLHVVNHGTHHRGQVSGFLRTMGQQPPPLDLIAYYRQL
jgi:uncharacterized damage-inducible protein DinB